MLTAAQAADLLGVGTRQAIHDRARRGGLLALHRGSRQVRFPSFQLVERPGATTRAVLPELGRVMRIFADAGVDEWTVASWFRTAAPLLEAMTPPAWLAEGRDPEQAIEPARRSAARLGQLSGLALPTRLDIASPAGGGHDSPRHLLPEGRLEV